MKFLKDWAVFMILGTLLVVGGVLFNAWTNRNLQAQCQAQGGVYHRSIEASRSRCALATQPKPVDKPPK